MKFPRGAQSAGWPVRMAGPGHMSRVCCKEPFGAVWNRQKSSGMLATDRDMKKAASEAASIVYLVDLPLLSAGAQGRN
jgi:hypothetical protein